MKDDAILRAFYTLPITLPLLGLATFLDFLTLPIASQMKEDWPAKIADLAFEIAGV